MSSCKPSRAGQPYFILLQEDIVILEFLSSNLFITTQNLFFLIAQLPNIQKKINF